MTYLVFSSLLAAQQRSAAAWQALDYPTGATRFLWMWQLHPADGRAALLIPPTSAEAQIDLPQASYEALLTTEEHAATVETLPGEGWSAAEL